MKEYVEVIKDSFVDYAGRTHNFVIAAVSSAVCDDSDSSILIVKNSDSVGEILGTVTKGIRIGISICNPEDEFSEKVGTLKAIARARNSEIVLYSSDNGYINTTLVKAFLRQEADYLKNNPENYIEGYNDSKARYLKRKEMNEMKDKFSEVERIVVEGVKKDPKYLDNVNKYLDWLKNQEQGKKCKKHGK